MKALWNTRHFAYRWSGWILITACIFVSVFLSINPPKEKEIALTNNFFQGIRGEKGQWTEKLARGEYTLTCESSESDGNTLKLKGVEARYIEDFVAQDPARRTLVWHITAPTATHDNEKTSDTLDGPLFIQVKDIDGTLVGSGKSDVEGPVLRRESGVWLGLAPLHWIQADESGKGEYFLPAGWRKENNDWFVVEHGPVVWNSMGTDLVRTLTADSLSAKDLTTGVLNDVKARLVGNGELESGAIWAERAEIAGTELRFPAPIKFENQNGWQGIASEGIAVRPGTSDVPGVLELKDFSASGLLNSLDTIGNAPKVNVRQARANGTRWSSAGLQMEGSVQWDLDVNEKDGNTTRYLLKAPRTFYRNASGDELPKDIAIGSISSEGYPVLTWNKNSLSAPKMTYLIKEQTWHLGGPVYGIIPGGSFAAGPASGSASHWIFNGSIRADYKSWGTLRGDRLIWDESPEPVYTFTGNPTVLVGIDRRLAGEKIVHKNNQLQFPNGVQGSLNFQGETFTLKADNAVIIGNENIAPGTSATLVREVRLTGRVECSAQGYRFSSKEANIIFENNRPKQITAKGDASLHGSLGSGSGDILELTFEQGKSKPLINWSGRVRGKTEVPFER
ncbi:MAG: hypothetical protein LBB40_02360 [Holophagales bacterium]|jgi:hypothetical protein|nr:hypothetical protein [Holophagales bacterium]